MAFSPFFILLGAAALCFGLSRLLSSRLLGLFAVAASLGAAIPAVLGRATEAPVPALLLLTLGEVELSVQPALAPVEAFIAAGMLVSAAAALLALAGAIGPSVRGFGAIFGWVLLMLAAALLSLLAPPLSLLQPLCWAVLTISAYSSLRAGGSSANEAQPPLGLSFGLLGSALLGAGLLATQGAVGAALIAAWPAALSGLLATLALVGAPPLAVARTEVAAVPAPLGALIYGIAAPAAALSWLLRAVELLPSLPPTWASVIGLVGAVGALACAAGALGQHQLRSMLIWLSAGQAALIVATAGLRHPLAALAGPALLLSLMLGAAVGSAAVASLDRSTGNDDYSEPGIAPPPIAGVAWVMAAMVTLGLPPLWGFWPHLWLLQAAQAQQPWLIAPLLAGAVLTPLALIAPLTRFWGPRSPADEPVEMTWGDLAPLVVAGLPLLLFGFVPTLLWDRWLSQLARAPEGLPGAPVAPLAVTAAGLLLLALLVALARSSPSRHAPRALDESVAHLPPTALGELLRPLAWIGAPQPLLDRLWAACLWASQALRFVIAIFEQRYYLLAMLVTLIMIMLLMAQ